jgi:hypothetical protein
MSPAHWGGPKGKEKTYWYDEYFAAMNTYKGNFARVWVLNSISVMTGWVVTIQDSQLGANYDLADAWRLDHILNVAKDNGVYIQLNLEDVNSFAYNWYNEGEYGEKNLYAYEAGGPCQDRWDYFTRQDTRDYAKRVYRYMVARYGYSTNLASWELWNEIDCIQYWTDLANTSELLAWHQEFGQWFKDNDPNDHLVTTSYGSFTPATSMWGLDEIEYGQMHGYYVPGWTAHPSDPLGRNMADFINYYTEMALSRMANNSINKPVVFGEFGIVNDSWIISQWQDGVAPDDFDGIHQHNGFWSGLMSGLASTPLAFWSHYCLEEGYPAYFEPCRAIANFVEGEDLGSAGYEPVSDGSISVSDEGLGALGLKNATGGLFWIQNRQHTWHNVVANGATPQTISGAAMTISSITEGDYTIKWWDTYAGATTGTTIASADGSGNLTVALPDIQKDVACKITPSVGGGDTTPPTTPAISTPAQVVNADTFAVELSTPSTDDNFSNYQVLGGQYSIWTNTGETGPFVFTLVQNAANTLSIRGRDTSGNVSSAASVVITEDSVLPTTPVIAGGDQVVDADSIVLTLASPSTDVHFSNYQLRGGQYASWTDVAETDNFQFTLTEGAAHTLRVRGTDEADNVSAAASVIVTEDSTYPTAPTIATQSQKVNADSMTVTLDSPSTDANFAGYQLRGGQYTSWTNTALTDNFVFNLIENTENMLQVRGTDAAGHVSAADSVTITEDSQAPDPPGQPVHTG